MNNIENLSSCIELINNDYININGLSNINENLEIHYLIYKITNLINGKYYIGLHKTKNPYDNYMGSGNLIKNAILKYGIKNFIKTIMYDFNNFNDMNNKEKEIVPLSRCYPQNKYSYNLNEGGNNGLKSKESIELQALNCKKTWHNKSEKELLEYSLLQSSLSKEKWKSKEYQEKWHNTINNRTIEQKEYTNTLKLLTIKNRSKEKLKLIHDNISNANKLSYKNNPNRALEHSKSMTGNKNPMYGHSITEYMTNNEIKIWKEHLREANSGINNPAYGRKWMHLKGSLLKKIEYM